MSKQQQQATGMATMSSGGTDFEPDPLLPENSQVDARLIGYCKIGTQEKDVWGSNGEKTGEVKEEKQAVLVFELVDPETYVDHGTDDEPKMVPRLAMKFVKDSSHEKSNQFSIAKALNKDAVWIDAKSKQGVVEPTLLLDCPVTLTMGINKAGDRNNISEFSAYPEKFRSQVEPSVGTKFMFCPDNGAFCDTTVADVPNWLLTKITTDATEQGAFKLIDDIEDQIEANQAAAESKKDDKVKLDGDDAPKKTAKSKKASKSAKGDKVEEEAKPSRRSRRGKKKDAVDVSSFTLEQLEDHLTNAGVAGSVLDDLADDNEDDDDYKAALVELAGTL